MVFCESFPLLLLLVNSLRMTGSSRRVPEFVPGDIILSLSVARFQVIVELLILGLGNVVRPRVVCPFSLMENHV